MRSCSVRSKALVSGTGYHLSELKQGSGRSVCQPSNDNERLPRRNAVLSPTQDLSSEKPWIFIHQQLKKLCKQHRLLQYAIARMEAILIYNDTRPKLTRLRRVSAKCEKDEAGNEWSSHSLVLVERFDMRMQLANTSAAFRVLAFCEVETMPRASSRSVSFRFQMS